MSEMTLDFNVGGNYSATLTQMISQADAYAKSADTVIGKVASLNVVTTALIAKTTALTGANKVATAQAAAYQQQLSGIEATAKVAGKSFDELRRTTLELGRASGSMGEAVHIMKTLHESGVTTEASMAKLGRTMLELGKANGTDGAALGQQIISLNKVFGNSQNQVSAFGDSLTTLSAKYGASASSTMSFAKALAPIAASAGISEGAVLGLSTAAARLGEDGFASANAFQRVLLDMSRAVRDGGPQLQKYALMLNTSEQSLAELFKQDPAEVIIRFTEAIRKGGPEAQRQLEALGLDSVRTIRSIQALSSTGDLRQIIDESAASYGNGSTAEGAATVMEGVNEQAGKLGETLSQTVSAAGQPFLQFLSKVLQLANGVADALRAIVASPLAQFLGTVLAPLQMVGSLGVQALMGLSTLALARRTIGFGARQAGDFSSAAMMARTGGALDDGASRASRAGFAYGAATPGGPTQPGSVSGAVSSAARSAGTAARSAALGGTMMVSRMFARDFNTADNDGRGARTGNAVTAPLRRWLGVITPSETAAPGAPAQGAAPAGAPPVVAPGGGSPKPPVVVPPAGAPPAGAPPVVAPGASQPNEPRRLGADRWNQWNQRSMGSQLGAAGRAAAAVPMEGAAFAGRQAGALAGMGAGMVQGMLPMLAIMGAFMAVSKTKDYWDDQASRRDKSTTEAAKDIYGQFNEFAAAAGFASKGLQSFGEAIQRTTKELVNRNTDLSQAFRLSADEISNAASQSYQRAFEPTTSNADTLAAQGRLLLGPDANPAEIKRFGMDIANKYGSQTAQQVLTQMEGTQGTSLRDILRSSEMAMGERTWLETPSGPGRTDTLDVTQRGVTSAVGNYVAETVTKYGEGAQQAANIAGAAQTYQQAVDSAKAGNLVAAQHFAESAAAAMGMSDPNYVVEMATEQKMSFDDMIAEAQRRRDPQDPKEKAKYAGQYAPDTYGFIDSYMLMRERNPNFNPLNPEFSMFASRPEIEGRVRGLEMPGSDLDYYLPYKPANKDGSYWSPIPSQREPGRETGAQDTIADILFGYNAFSQGRANEVSGGAVAMEAFRNSPNDLDKLDVAAQYLLDASRNMAGSEESGAGSAGMNFALAMLMSQQTQGLYTEGAAEYRALARQQEMLAQGAALSQYGTGIIDKGRSGIATMRYLDQLPLSENEQVNQARGQARSQATADVGGELMAMKQFVLAKMQTDLQIKRMDEDAYLQRERAADDFHTQMLNAEDDYNRQRARATEDFNLQVTRSEEDYQTQRGRAKRDFERQEIRAERDFHIQRQRAERDFAKQMSRMVEDNAKSIYDPYKRIQAQQVWDAKSLLTNLKEQNQAIAQQASDLDKAKSLGLSDAVISQLQLADPKNAQQLSRLIEDLMNDPSLVAQYNKTAVTRKQGTKDVLEYSDPYKRAVDDFETSMEDSEKDFRRSMRRSRKDFETSLQDMHDDYVKGLKRSRQDFRRSMDRNAEDYEIMLDRANKQFNKSLLRMDQDLEKAEARMLEDLGNFMQDVTGGPQGILTAFDAAMEDFNGRMLQIPEKIRPQMSDALKGMWEDAAGDMATYLDQALAPYGLDHTALINGGNGPGATGRPGSPSTSPGNSNPDNTYAEGGLVTGPGTSTSDSVMIQASVNEYVMNAAAVERIGVWNLDAMNKGFATGPAPSPAEYSQMVGAQDRIEAAEKRIDQKMRRLTNMQHRLQRLLAKITEQNRHVHPAPNPNMHHQGDGGSNHHQMHRRTGSGAGRHVNDNDVRTARTASYSSPVTNNYNYDQRTQVTGPITVKANDPRKMVGELRRAIAHSRLVSPASAGATTSV